jgi:hypothetical protein
MITAGFLLTVVSLIILNFRGDYCINSWQQRDNETLALNVMEVCRQLKVPCHLFEAADVSIVHMDSILTLKADLNL